MERKSRPVRGAWIETFSVSLISIKLSCRVPYGARGLKRYTKRKNIMERKSRPVRGAWIETFSVSLISIKLSCRVPYGTRGLKQQ